MASNRCSSPSLELIGGRHERAYTSKTPIDATQQLVKHERIRDQILAQLTPVRLAAVATLLCLSISCEVYCPPDFGVQEGERWKAFFVVDTIVLGILLIMDGLPADAVLLGLPVLYVLAGIISEQQAFAGFGSPGVVAFAGLFALSEAFVEVKVLDSLLARFLGSPRRLWAAQLRVMLPVALLSAFFNNGPLVSMVIPIVQGWAKRNGHPPAQLLMPLAFASTLGGTITIIGSAANLVAQDRARHLTPPVELAFFDLTPVALPLTGIGILYMLLAAPRLLPQNPAETLLACSSSFSLVGLDDRPEEHPLPDMPVTDSRAYRMLFVVRSRSPLIGRSALDVGLSRVAEVLEIKRGGQELCGRALDEPWCAGDILKIAAPAEGVASIRKAFDGLEPVVHRDLALLGAHRRRRRLLEAVVAHNSSLLRSPLSEQQERLRRTGCVILAIRRPGRQSWDLQNPDVKEHLQPGDVLLLEAFSQRVGSNTDFSLVAAVEGSKPPRRGRRQDKLRGALCLLGFIVVIALNGLNLTPLASGVLALNILCCFAKVMDWQEATLAVNGSVMVAMASSFGISAAMTTSGAAKGMALRLVGAGLRFGSMGVLCMVYAGTAILTNIISNTATCVLMVPVAMSVAKHLAAAGGEVEAVSEKSFLLLVIFAANAAFATPLGSACNMLVVQPGGYSFSDFLKFGGLLQVVMMLSTCTLIQVVAL